MIQVSKFLIARALTVTCFEPGAPPDDKCVTLLIAVVFFTSIM
jgi:hypothetical protein